MPAEGLEFILDFPFVDFGSSCDPQPLYSMILLGSWETKTAPVTSCKDDISKTLSLS